VYNVPIHSINSPGINLAGHWIEFDEGSQNFRNEKEQKMANKNLKLKLTSDQQRQIKEATGKDVSELNIGIASGGEITEDDLENVAGGAKKICHFTQN
jgi:hypothetical protein